MQHYCAACDHSKAEAGVLKCCTHVGHYQTNKLPHVRVVRVTGHMTSFYPRDASQLLAVVVCLSVHPSVCLSQVGVLLKQQNV